MKPKPIIVVIGAASATFGPKVLRDIIHHPDLGGSTVRFVDIAEDRLDIFTRLARRLNEGLDHPVVIESTTDRTEALRDADYVLLSIDIERTETWEQDFRLPVDLGIRQVTGELGGPGGLFHSLRQIPVHLEIGRDIAEICPDAIVMVESNPLNRICLAMERYTGCGQILGLCHGVEIAQNFIGKVVGLETDDVLATAAGVNHFHWILDLRRKADGTDLYPEFREKLKDYDPKPWALSRKLFDVYGYFPSCGDDHIGEYLPFAWEFCGLEGPNFEARARGTEDLWRYYEEQARGEGPIKAFEGEIGGGHYEERLQWFFAPRSWVDTLAFPIINSVYTDTFIRMPAVNMINDGAISNLPAGVFVEGPAAVDSSGVRLLSIGELPGTLAAFCRRDVDQMEMTVEAAVKGDRSLVLQAMLLDPVVDSISTAERVLDAMMKAQAEYLPQFA
jgi:alpha-galactosidase